MVHALSKTRWLLTASALAGLLTVGCDNNTEPAQEANPGAVTPSPVSHPGGSGILQSPQVPTDQQVQTMEALGKNQKQPVLPQIPAGSRALAKTAGADYNLNFNDYNALALPSDHDYATFAPFYIPQVRYGVWAYVMPMSDGHFHMIYENPNICIPSVSGKYGLMSGYSCVAVGDAATQPRYLAPHEASETVQTYVWDGSNKYVFDLKSIYLEPTSDPKSGHIQIWIHKIDVGWRYWADLPSGPGGYTWYFPQTGTGGAQGIDEVRLTSPNPSGGYIWSADNMVINVH